MEKVRGYKVFNPDWTCRGFQYEVGKTYHHEGPIELCQAGFHFCEKLIDCFTYYFFELENKVAEVIATGEVIKGGGGKCVTNRIEIVREISWNDVWDLVNMGNGNSGIGNTGDRNIGSRNSGNMNSGNFNSGDCNTGHHNTGRYNSGYQNSGDFNSGYYNSGNWNSGMFNACDYANGLFNSKSPKIYMFNKPTDMTFKAFQKKYPEACGFLARSAFELTKWVCEDMMTVEEKEENPNYKVQGGYLKTYTYKEACQQMWDRFSETERNLIKKLPNFNKKIFKEITGIEVS